MWWGPCFPEEIQFKVQSPASLLYLRNHSVLMRKYWSDAWCDCPDEEFILEPSIEGL